jgi:nitrite reductase/ring-hydroxylating ferredoxin subunit/uncharacterized membrane protein
VLLAGFVDAIQDQPFLDAIAERIQPLLQQAVRQHGGTGATLKNILSGTWIGHPLHPILKDIPIGAWTMAAIFDAMHSATEDDAVSFAADISIATGLAGALASAVTGLSDWSDTTGRARRVGAAHALLNVTATVCYSASLLMRSRNRAAATNIAYIGYAALLAGGYLGGHLVFGEQIGVNHAAQDSLPTKFVSVIAENALLENQPQRASANGVPIVLVRQNGSIYALFERCSHMGGPLSEGALEGTSVRCPWHGSRFALRDGTILEGPATTPQPCFETRIVDGWVQVRAAHHEAP